MGIRNGLTDIERYIRLAAIAQPLAEGSAFQMVQAATPDTAARVNSKRGPTSSRINEML